MSKTSWVIIYVIFLALLYWWTMPDERYPRNAPPGYSYEERPRIPR